MKENTAKAALAVAGEKRASKEADFIAVHFEGPESLENLFAHLPPDLAGWADLYLRLQVEGVKSKGTLKLERYSLNNFIAFFKDYHQGRDIRRWRPKTSQRFVEHLTALGLSPRTIHRNLVCVRTFGRWVLSIWPSLFPLGDPTKGIKAPTQDALRPKGLDERQVKRVLDAAYHRICQVYPDAQRIEQLEGSREAWFLKAHRRMRRPIRDFAIIMLMLNAGLRRQEVCNLTLEQLQGKHLRQVKCKGNLYRDILLGEETLRAIAAYLKEERGRDTAAFAGSTALFLPSASRRHRNRSGSLSPRSINAIVAQIQTAANEGLSSKDRIKLTPHKFRHTHAYQILKKGRSLPYLQKRLGHQSMNYLALYAQMPEKEEQKLLDDAEFK